MSAAEDKPRIYLSPPDVGCEERDLLLAAFDSNWIAPLGPQVDEFERELAGYVGTTSAVALSSGTAGLHLAMILLGVGEGDEVVVPTLTFAATANAVRYVGASPVLVDCSRDCWTIDADLVEELLETRARAGRLPRALVTVDLYGQCADYDRLRQLCARYGIPIVQDAAEALGARWRDEPAGRQGDFGVVSFNGNKIITCGGGGALLTHSADGAARARYFATQAREPVLHYEHRAVGYNYRLSNLLAAVGRAQLRKLDRYVERRRAIRRLYHEALGAVPGFELMPQHPRGTPSCWLTCGLVDPRRSGASRDSVIAALQAQSIEARPVWKPLHLQPVFAHHDKVRGDVAEDLFTRGICLPSGSGLTDAAVARVCDIVSSSLRGRELEAHR